MTMKTLLHSPRSFWSLLLVVAACGGGGAPISHEVLTSTASLQTAFNRDSGHVRAIFLASPT